MKNKKVILAISIVSLAAFSIAQEKIGKIYVEKQIDNKTKELKQNGVTVSKKDGKYYFTIYDTRKFLSYIGVKKIQIDYSPDLNGMVLEGEIKSTNSITGKSDIALKVIKLNDELYMDTKNIEYRNFLSILNDLVNEKKISFDLTLKGKEIVSLKLKDLDYTIKEIKIKKPIGDYLSSGKISLKGFTIYELSGDTTNLFLNNLSINLNNYNKYLKKEVVDNLNVENLVLQDIDKIKKEKRNNALFKIDSFSFQANSEVKIQFNNFRSNGLVDFSNKETIITYKIKNNNFLFDTPRLKIEIPELRYESKTTGIEQESGLEFINLMKKTNSMTEEELQKAQKKIIQLITNIVNKGLKENIKIKIPTSKVRITPTDYEDLKTNIDLNIEILPNKVDPQLLSMNPIIGLQYLDVSLKVNTNTSTQKFLERVVGQRQIDSIFKNAKINGNDVEVNIFYEQGRVEINPQKK